MPEPELPARDSEGRLKPRKKNYLQETLRALEIRHIQISLDLKKLRQEMEKVYHLDGI